MLLETRALTLRRGERELLRGLDWVVQAGERWAVVGANGTGKSTLLAALAAGGGPTATEGRVLRAPGAWVVLVAQHEAPEAPWSAASLRDLARGACGPLLELGRELERRAGALGPRPTTVELENYGAWQALFQVRGGYDLDTRLDAALTRVGLADAAEHPAAAASGGERRRARLAGALVSGADVLLLDEPTNHLDLAARGALAEHLARFPGAIVFAGHDRAWIDAVATHVLWLGDASPGAEGAGPGDGDPCGGAAVRKLRGGWSAARRAIDEARRIDAKAERLRRRRAAELEAMAAELRAHGHQKAHVRRRRAERELAALGPAAPAPRTVRGPSLELDATNEGGELARFEHAGDGVVLRDLNLTLRGGERWALIGPSGSGKTTLLRLLAGELGDGDPRARRWWRPGVSLWHLDQHGRGIADEVTPLRALTAWVGTARAQGLLSQVRLPHPTWSRPARTLSGGERARAGLALLMAREADVLLLDEPTNDLDLPMIEALESALANARSAMVVATHDARLVEALGAEVVTVEEGALVRWRGGLDGWRRGARRLEAEVGTADAAGPATGAADAPGPATEAADAGRVEDQIAWDRRRAAAEEALADPLRWGERDLERWRDRRRAAEEALLGAWARSAVPPEPPWRTREGGWRVWGEPVEQGLHVWLDGDEQLAHLTVRIARTGSGQVAHLAPRTAADRSLTRWARRALLRGAARLAFYAYAVDAVQVAADEDPGGFEPLAPGWWVWRRATLEREEGWRRPTPARPRRRPLPRAARETPRRRRGR